MERLGRYTLVKRVGAGGMGEVFLATEPGSPHPLILKRVLPTLVANSRFLRLFLDETRIASRLNHPNIVRIRELGEAAGSWFVAMDYVPGKDLRELLRRAREMHLPVPHEVIVRIAIDVAHGLAHAHQATDEQGRELHIVHRDVSPHNVLIARDGSVKLIDFGVAKAANKAIHTGAGLLKGKFPYMAPEQSRGAAVDARTDVFALGIVMWEALTGEYLFRGKSDAQTVKLVRACIVAPPSEYRADIPKAIDDIVMKALRKDPEQRFATASAMAEALESVAAELPLANVAGWLFELDDVPGLDTHDDDDDVLQSVEPTVVDSIIERTVVSRAPSHVAGAQSQPRRLPAALIGRSTNLVPTRSSFVGRVAELADLHQVFRQGARLVTLTGGIGVGKSRMLNEFGAQLVTYFKQLDEQGLRRGGVWWCDLTNATDGDGICVAVAAGLGIPLSPGDAVTQLGHALAARGEVLLLLDGVEKVASLCGPLLQRWLSMALESRLYLSSRAAIQIDGEQRFEIHPLKTVDAHDAVDLLVERAKPFRTRWSERQLQGLHEIVRQLDGVPLAIELAAPLLERQSVEEVLAGLNHRLDVLVNRNASDSRQATLRGAIDWSWETLTTHEAAVLAQLSVFEGGFTKDAAGAVVALGDSAPPLNTVLDSLQAKSLLRTFFPRGEEHEQRWVMFETVRHYAAEKLVAADGVSAVERRHAEFFVSLGTHTSRRVEGDAGLLDVLALERENVLAVVRRGLAPGGRDGLALEAMLALDSVLVLRGPFQVHAALLDAAMERSGADSLLRARGHEARARVRLARGKAEDARVDLEHMLAGAQSLGRLDVEARALSYLGTIDRLSGQRERAQARFQRALELFDECGDGWMKGRTLSNFAVLLQEMSREPEALEVYNIALELHRHERDRRYEGVTLANLGVLQQALGLLRQARANYQAALAIHRELKSRRSEGISHINLGDLSRDLSQTGRARSHYARALAILGEVGARRFEGITLVSLASLFHEQGSLANARGCFQQGIDVLTEVGDQRYRALGLAGLAAVSAVQGKLDEASQLMAQASTVLSSGDAGFREALEMYRAHLELGQLLLTQSETEAAVLEERIRRRVEAAETIGAPTAVYPQGAPSPAARSEHVRAALRALKVALTQFA